jgi:hypothetical protein
MLAVRERNGRVDARVPVRHVRRTLFTSATHHSNSGPLKREPERLVATRQLEEVCYPLCSDHLSEEIRYLAHVGPFKPFSSGTLTPDRLMARSS